MLGLVPPEVERNGSCRSVVSDFFHQCSNRSAVFSLGHHGVFHEVLTNTLKRWKESLGIVG